MIAIDWIVWAALGAIVAAMQLYLVASPHARAPRTLLVGTAAAALGGAAAHTTQLAIGGFAVSSLLGAGVVAVAALVLLRAVDQPTATRRA